MNTGAKKKPRKGPKNQWNGVLSYAMANKLRTYSKKKAANNNLPDHRACACELGDAGAGRSVSNRDMVSTATLVAPLQNLEMP